MLILCISLINYNCLCHVIWIENTWSTCSALTTYLVTINKLSMPTNPIVINQTTPICKKKSRVNSHTVKWNDVPLTNSQWSRAHKQHTSKCSLDDRMETTSPSYYKPLWSLWGWYSCHHKSFNFFWIQLISSTAFKYSCHHISFIIFFWIQLVSSTAFNLPTCPSHPQIEPTSVCTCFI